MTHYPNRETNHSMVKAFHHICIQTEDFDASLQFYRDILGFEVIKDNKGFHTRAHNTWLQGPGILIELQTPKEKEQFREWSKLNSGPVHIALLVDDVQKMFEHFKKLDHQRYKIKNGKIVYSVNENTTIFKAIAPEGTEVEIRDNMKLD